MNNEINEALDDLEQNPERWNRIGNWMYINYKNFGDFTKLCMKLDVWYFTNPKFLGVKLNFWQRRRLRKIIRRR